MIQFYYNNELLNRKIGVDQSETRIHIGTVILNRFVRFREMEVDEFIDPVSNLNCHYLELPLPLGGN